MRGLASLTVAVLLAGSLVSCGSREQAGGRDGAPGAGGAVTDGPHGGGGAPVAGGAGGDGGATGVGGVPGSDAASGSGGLPASGGASGAGGVSGTGTTVRTGGTFGTGGIVVSGGASGSGGLPGTGGASATGGLTGSGGGPAAGGASAAGGAVASGGTDATGGIAATGGAQATGGATGTGGTTGTCTVGAVPSGGTDHCVTKGLAEGTVGGYVWRAWTNGSGACLVTYDDAGAAFSATWDNSGDFLALVGLEWDATRTHDQIGTIKAQFAEKKTGAATSFSYIGVYGWSIDPCAEWYILEDSFSPMPISLGSPSSKGTATIDGGTYNLYSGTMSSTGVQCGSSSGWKQYYSVRQTARQCGQISITEHFKAWHEAGMILGKLDSAMLLVEAMGGTGRVDFTAGSLTVE